MFDDKRLVRHNVSALMGPFAGPFLFVAGDGYRPALVDRAALLVDVGYLLAEGGKAYCGATRRSQVRCNYAEAAGALEKLAHEHCGMPLLRQYWYDGAPDYVPTQDHLQIGALPRVKLRLGRLVERRRGQVEQKGVDSLIVHDLITLAHERAVTTVYLLAGDEDLREGVAAAQRLGVQVVLIGIPTSRPNQSDPLVRESDEVLLVQDALLREHFERAGVEPGHEEEGPLSDAAREDPEAAVGQAARAFATTWRAAAEPTELADLLARRPAIPRQLDVQLLVAAEEAVGRSLRGEQQLRHVLRDQFWAEIAASTGDVGRG